MSGTTKAQLQQVQRLLKAKKYDQARRLLVTIDHPTARKWLEKLDKIAPVKPLGSRNVIGWLRDHILIAGIGGAIVLALGMLVIVPMLNSEKCNEEMVRTWWYKQEDIIQEFVSDVEGGRSAMGDNLPILAAEMQQPRDAFAAAPVPECADARIFGNYEQILDSMDAVFVIITDYQNGELSPVEYGDAMRATKHEITNGGVRAIRDVLHITFD